MKIQILFYLLLLSQVFLLSWYLPKVIQKRMQYIFNNYSFEEYPKLYGGSLEKTQKNYRRHVLFNDIMIIVGILLIAALIFFADRLSSGLVMMIVFFYGMTQAIPVIVMDIAMMRHCKKLRDEDQRTERKAELVPRSIFNHISMAEIIVVVFFYIAACTFDMYTKSFDTSLGAELYEAVIILTLTNLFFIGLIRWRVYGKKLNPYLDNKDNNKELDTIVKSAQYTSIAVSLFLIAMRAVNVYDLEQLEGAVMSIYLQCIFFFGILQSIKKMKIEDINFEAFRADAS